MLLLDVAAIIAAVVCLAGFGVWVGRMLDARRLHGGRDS
jgi:hypothetical protein